MERIGGIDPMFIYSDTPATPMEVAYACILDPTTAPAGYTFDGVRAVLAERVPHLPPFRRRLMPVPLGLDHPRWVDDPEFDLDNHLHREALPEPGGEAEFSAAVAAIMSHQLCPEQPPWEMHVIEGLVGGRVGLVAKVHHSVLDGVAGAQLLAQLLDLTPEGRPVTDTCPPWTPPDLPSRSRLLGDAMPNIFTSPFRAARAMREVGKTAVRMLRCALDGDTGPLSIPLFAPKTFEEAPICTGRVVAFNELGLPEINEIRSRFGVTMNDVVLAVCAGALRRHLGDRVQHADGPLVAIVPVSVRPRDGDQGLGNRLSAMFVSLATDRERPQDRIVAIAESSMATKAQERAVGYGPMASALADAVPPALVRPVLRATQQAGVLRRLRAGNLMVSNVPGPDFALYFAGMRLEAVHPMGPLVDGVVLNITVQSYESSMFVGINACSAALPDVRSLAACMTDELKALLEAARVKADEERSRVAAHRAMAAAGLVARSVPRSAAGTSHGAQPSARRQLPTVYRGMSWD